MPTLNIIISIKKREKRLLFIVILLI